MELTIEQAFRQAIAEHEKGNLQNAERLYRALLKALPNHPDANHNLGVLAVAMGKFEDAIPYFKRALDANSKSEQFWASYTYALIQTRRIEDAKQVLDEASRLGVASAKLKAAHEEVRRLSLGQGSHPADGPELSEDAGQGGDARVHNTIRTSQSTSIEEPVEDQIKRLRAAYQTGCLKEAEILAASLTQEFPLQPLGWKILGAVLKQTGRVTEALTAKKKSVELTPSDANAHFTLGVTLKDLGRLSEAEASYRTAIALQPSYAEALNNLGIALQEQGRLEEAEVTLRQAIAVNPQYAEAHANLGVNLKARACLDQAETSLRRAIKVKPNFPEAHYNLANCLREIGRLDEAEVSYKNALAIRPDYPEAHGNLGATLQDLGKLIDAKKSYESALALKPDYAKAHRHIAMIKTFESRDKQFLQMQKMYRDKSYSTEKRCHICFALAKASEDLGDFLMTFDVPVKHIGRKKIGFLLLELLDQRLDIVDIKMLFSCCNLKKEGAFKGQRTGVERDNLAFPWEDFFHAFHDELSDL